MTEPAPAPAPALAPAPAPAPAAWHSGLDAEIIGHIQNRGLTLDDPKLIVDNLAKAHREATGKLGVPADQLLRMVKPDSPEADVKAFWGKLGAPADAKEYDFSGIKDAKGETIKPELADALRASFARRFVPKETALEIAKDLAKFNEGDAQQQAAAKTARLEQDRADLAKSWGPNEKTNKFVAEQARIALQKSLGLPDDKMVEAVNALENAYGYANVMKLFHLVGTKIGEDKFIGGGGGSNSPMTREQAVARKADLMRDTAWTQRYMNAGAAERTEMLNLNRIITGDFESAA